MKWYIGAGITATLLGCQREQDSSGPLSGSGGSGATREAGRDAEAPARDRGEALADATSDSSAPSPDPDAGTCGARCGACPHDDNAMMGPGVWCATDGGPGYVGAEILPYHGPVRLEENLMYFPDGRYMSCLVTGGWGVLLGRDVWADILETGGRDCECRLVGVSIREAPDAPPVLLAFNGDFLPEFPLFRDHGLTLDVGALCPRVDLGNHCPGGYRQDAELVFANADGQRLGLFPFQTGRLSLPAGDAEVGLGPSSFSDGCDLPASNLELVVRIQDTPP